MIAVRHLRGDVYEYCSNYYLKEQWRSTYAGVVYTIPHHTDWVIPDEVLEIIVLPLDVRTVSDCQRKHKIPSASETI